MKRRRIRNGLLLPRPRAGLERECRDVEELGDLQERRPPHRRIGRRRLGEVPCRASHHQKVVMTTASVPRAGAIRLQEVEEVEAVIGAGVDGGAVEIPKGVDAGIVREVDGIGGGGIGGEAWVFEHTAMEEEFQHHGVSSVPAVGAVVGLLAEAVVGEERAKVAGDRVLRTVREEIEVETRRETADVDPTVAAVIVGDFLRQDGLG